MIPPCPELLVRLQAAMAEREPDLNEVARIAAADIAMSATLLRNANGPRFAGSQPARTVGQAMNRLGLDESAAIMTGFLAQNAIPANHPRLQRFWEQSRKRAQAMAFIARQLAGLPPDLAHAYGLFCHVGLPVLLQSLRGYGATMVEAAARIDRPFVATENANHRTDHAVAGALVTRAWHFAPEVMAAIRLHHEFQVLSDSSTEPEVRTLVAAGLVAEHVMRRHEGLMAESDWNEHAVKALAWLGIGEDDLAYWRDELEAALDAA